MRRSTRSTSTSKSPRWRRCRGSTSIPCERSYPEGAMRSRPPVTVGELFRFAVRRFERSNLHFGHGTHTARDEAGYLILHGLGLPLDSIAAYVQRELTAAARRALR